MEIYLPLLIRFSGVQNVVYGSWINLPHQNYTNQRSIEKIIAILVDWKITGKRTTTYGTTNYTALESTTAETKR